MFQKIVENGYITSIVSGASNGNITEEEYNTILAVIRSKPTAPEGFDYQLKTDLTWELVEVPIVDEPNTYTAEQLAEMTNAELSTILADMGISTNMDKDNMIDLVLYKQNGVIE